MLLINPQEGAELAHYATTDETETALQVMKAAAAEADQSDFYWLAAIFHAGMVYGIRQERIKARTKSRSR